MKQYLQNGSDGLTGEKPRGTEQRIRRLLVTTVLLGMPVALLLFYLRWKFAGLAHYEAMDFAQLGRNISSGQGFTTYVLRPLGLAEGGSLRSQPELVHGPLFPVILAAFFGVLGAHDWVAALVSSLFLLLTIGATYLVAARAFDRTVALASAAILACNALLLEYAASGLNITLCMFLGVCLLGALYDLARQQEEEPAAVPRGPLIRTGILAGLLYLAEPVMIWPAAAGLAAALLQTRRPAAARLLLAPFAVVAGPWMVRNGMLTGNPVFGLAGMEVWMNTRAYPGLDAYRMTAGELTPGLHVLKSVVLKVLTGFGEIIGSFPQITGSWVLAFFLPGLLFRLPGEPAHRLRGSLVAAFAALAAGMLFFGVRLPLLVTLVPLLMVFSVAFLAQLLRQAEISPASRGSAIALLAVAVSYPLLSETLLGTRARPVEAVSAAVELKRASLVDEAVLTDQPWFVAWYSNRPAIWIPASDRDVSRLRTRYASARWLFLTDKARAYSPEWRTVYDTLQAWGSSYNLAALQGGRKPELIRMDGQQRPLFAALQGFTAYPPAERGTPTAVLAQAPERNAAAPQRPERQSSAR